MRFKSWTKKKSCFPRLLVAHWVFVHSESLHLRSWLSSLWKDAWHGNCNFNQQESKSNAQPNPSICSGKPMNEINKHTHVALKSPQNYWFAVPTRLQRTRGRSQRRLSFYVTTVSCPFIFTSEKKMGEITKWKLNSSIHHPEQMWDKQKWKLKHNE